MRPVRLDMHGFASFRDAARVDFTDADFFALVGATGSGKSTVIDAMTFALYGSVPRWGRKGMVSLALAPTVARGTVKLVFEADGQRYVVARELRRVGASVSQRAASLERLADADGLAAPGDVTFPLAKDLDGVNEAVEKLLGLRYEDFTQCVVLPQGQFAAFLHAKPAERQEILLRLLGAEHYKLMMAKANQRAAASGQRAATYGEELLGYADATAEAERSALAARDTLTGLGERVSATLPLIAARREELAAAEARLARLRAEAATLAELRVPDGTGRLDADLAAGRAALAERRTAEESAEAADAAARDALAAGPQRAPLELARAQRAEHARHQAAVPELAAEVTTQGERATRASAAVDAAASALEEARAERDVAAAAARAVADQVTALAAEHARLAAVAVPGEVAELDRRGAAAADALTAAAGALEEAERAEEAARRALAAATPEAPLAQAQRDLGELRDALGAGAAARAAARRAAAAREAADTALADAERERTARLAELELASRGDVVAALRPHLVAGEPCPVCEQPVAVLPAPRPAGELDAAQGRLAAAERAVTAARAAARDAAAAAARAEAGHAGVLSRRAALVESLRAVLAGPLGAFALPAVHAVAAAVADQPTATEPTASGPTASGPTASEPTGSEPGASDAAGALLPGALTEVAALALARGEAGQAAEHAVTAVRRARSVHRAAQRAAEAAEAGLADARRALRAARDPLVELGAPSVEGMSLAEAWAALAGWAGERAGQRSAALESACRDAAAAARRHEAGNEAFGAADQSLTALRGQARAAAEADQRARAALSQVTARLAELGDLLAGAPDEEQVSAGLALRDRLESGAAAAETALRTARAGRAESEAALTALESAERAARGALSAARDRVVALGAPALNEHGLLAGWTELVIWAGGQAEARDREAADAERTARTARAGIAELTGQLRAELAGAGIELAAEALPDAAAAAVAGAVEEARAVARRVTERRAQAAALADKQRTAAEEQQVAHLLGNLLQARQFPQWLVSEALDDLVAAASTTLAALSGGQFDLAHDKGDLFVIDHADADARRSVRTLSGGETFQASLALALALSTQISALAAAGGARLDSIFLDEGFGTLDAETLEVVATTLEALAQGERMVGVVTHVTELAERVPVRFRVTRDARTSAVAREGLSPGAGAVDTADAAGTVAVEPA